MPNAYKLMCFDRNINENRDVKFLEWDYWSLHWRKNLTLAASYLTFARRQLFNVFLKKLHNLTDANKHNRATLKFHLDLQVQMVYCSLWTGKYTIKVHQRKLNQFCSRFWWLRASFLLSSSHSLLIENICKIKCALIEKGRC